MIDIYKELEEYGIIPCVYDPHIDQEELKHEYGISAIDSPDLHAPYGAVIFAVKHSDFNQQLSLAKCIELQAGQTPVILDLKGHFTNQQIEAVSNISYFRL